MFVNGEDGGPRALEAVQQKAHDGKLRVQIDSVFDMEDALKVKRSGTTLKNVLTHCAVVKCEIPTLPNNSAAGGSCTIAQFLRKPTQAKGVYGPADWMLEQE